MVGCRPRRSRGMARRGGLLVAAAALVATVWSAAPAHDEGVAWPGWAEIGWVRVWPTGSAAKVDLRGRSVLHSFFVLVVPERMSERAVYLDAGRTLCTTDELCTVIFLSRLGGPLHLGVRSGTSRYVFGAYSRSVDGETLHVPCESANIEGCNP